MKLTLLQGLLLVLFSTACSQFKVSVLQHNIVCNKPNEVYVKNVLNHTVWFFISAEYFDGKQWKEFDNDILRPGNACEKWTALHKDSSVTAGFIIANCLTTLRKTSKRVIIRLVVNYGNMVDLVNRKKYWASACYLDL